MPHNFLVLFLVHPDTTPFGGVVICWYWAGCQLLIVDTLPYQPCHSSFSSTVMLSVGPRSSTSGPWFGNDIPTPDLRDYMDVYPANGLDRKVRLLDGCNIDLYFLHSLQQLHFPTLKSRDVLLEYPELVVVPQLPLLVSTSSRSPAVSFPVFVLDGIMWGVSWGVLELYRVPLARVSWRIPLLAAVQPAVVWQDGREVEG